MDGTFSTAPPQFYQLYTISSFVHNSIIPGAYILLSNADTDTYLRAFSELVKQDLMPTSVMTGFIRD